MNSTEGKNVQSESQFIIQPVTHPRFNSIEAGENENLFTQETAIEDSQRKSLNGVMANGGIVANGQTPQINQDLPDN